jgi:hypothetical protein
MVAAIEKPFVAFAPLPHADAAFFELLHYLFKNFDLLSGLFCLEFGDACGRIRKHETERRFPATLCPKVSPAILRIPSI